MAMAYARRGEDGSLACGSGGGNGWLVGAGCLGNLRRQQPVGGENGEDHPDQRQIKARLLAGHGGFEIGDVGGQIGLGGQFAVAGDGFGLALPAAIATNGPGQLWDSLGALRLAWWLVGSWERVVGVVPAWWGAVR